MMGGALGRTVWPWLNGWISRKAKTFSDSKSLKEGISPGGVELVWGSVGCRGQERRTGRRVSIRAGLPLMILQKMQAAMLNVVDRVQSEVVDEVTQVQGPTNQPISSMGGSNSAL